MTASPGHRAVVLVTGMSGTGKSTTLRALADRGHAVLDTDEPGWISVVAGEPLWDLDRIRRVLDSHRTGALFVGGCVVNQRELYERFDAVVLLTAPLPVLLARVVARDNPFGSTPADRERIARDVADHLPRLRAGATHEVDTTVPTPDVVSAVEALAGC